MSVLILTEGPDDCHTIKNLIERASLGSARFFSPAGVEADYVLRYLGGYENLRKGLRVELATHFTHVAIVVDHDVAQNHRWQSITDRIREAASELGFEAPAVPVAPSLGGDIFPMGGIVAGVWLWPDHGSEGDMETFAAAMIPPENNLWAHASRTVEELPDPKEFKTSYFAKAKIHTWLAWQEEPGQQIGEAIRGRKLIAETASARAFLTWLTRVRDTPL